MATTTNNIFNNELFQNKSLRPYKPFGLNVHVPEKTLKQISEAVKENSSNEITSVPTYFATNEDVFSGRVGKEIKSLEKESSMTSQILDNADALRPRKFEMHM